MEGVDTERTADQTKPSQNTFSGPNLKFVVTPPGAMMIINWILLFLSWCIMAGWRGSVHSAVADHISGTTSFYLFTTVFPWLMFIVIFVVLLFGLDKRVTIINWSLTLAINCAVWAVLLLISSSIVADKADDDYHDSYWKGDSLKAAAAFGFFSMVGLGIEGALHLKEFLGR